MRNLTLMLCGPHASREWSPLYHRVDHAVSVARETGTPLLVVGDSHDGRAVSHFAEYARDRGVASVIEAYDSGGYTQTDVQAALRAIRDDRRLVEIRGVLIVTDDWHYVRAMRMFVGEMPKILGDRRLEVHDRSTDAGPRPPPVVIEGERRGLQDYLAGRPHRPYGPPFGKPFHPASSDVER